MATITFRTDELVDEALAELTSGDVDRSTAIRGAILQAWESKKRQELREETQRIANDPADRAEIRAIQKDFEDLRAW